MNLQPEAILRQLAWDSPTPYIGITVYVMMALAFITLFLQKKSTIWITSLCILVVILCLIDKVVVGQAGGIPYNDIGALLIRVPIFVAPFIVAGMTRWEKSVPPAVVGGLIGIFYTILRWFFEMRPG